MKKQDTHQNGVSLNLRKDVHKVAPDVAITFLKGIMPFNELDDETLQSVAHHCRVDFFPKGTRLLTVDKTEITHLFLIQRGGVKAFIVDDEGDVTLKDYRGVGSYCGALGIIRGTRANLNIETLEDTFCYLLPREIFLDLVRSQPHFTHYYLKNFSEKVVNTAYQELRHHKVARRSMEDLYLFSIKAGDLVKELHKVSEASTIQEAARAMSYFGIGSLLIHDPGNEEEIVGIVTDRDLRSKVVSAGLDYGQSVKTIMSGPVLSVSSETVCFDVLVKMMSTGIHHLAVERGGNIVGVITTHDITVLQGNSPFYLFKEIVSQRTIEGLYPLPGKIPNMIRHLIKEGGKASKIVSMITILNDRILSRLLTLLEKEMGPPPANYCWLLFGSEGRKEQTFLTDQDNGIVYTDPKNKQQQIEFEKYFQELGVRAIDSLVKCGYPLCPRDTMASNLRWCQPYSVWKGYYTGWAKDPYTEEAESATVFFDFRSGHGDESLAIKLREHFIESTIGNRSLTLSLSRRALAYRVPLSFFNNFIIERDGEHKNQLDIKHQGIVPFVDFARILALHYGIRETNTMARMKVLHTEGHLEHDLYLSATESFKLQMQMRLIHQLDQIEKNLEPDNYIAPADLTELERRMLKDAFVVIEKLQSVLDEMHPVL